MIRTIDDIQDIGDSTPGTAGVSSPLSVDMGLAGSRLDSASHIRVDISTGTSVSTLP